MRIAKGAVLFLGEESDADIPTRSIRESSRTPRVPLQDTNCRNHPGLRFLSRKQCSWRPLSTINYLIVVAKEFPLYTQFAHL